MRHMKVQFPGHPLSTGSALLSATNSCPVSWGNPDSGPRLVFQLHYLLAVGLHLPVPVFVSKTGTRVATS